MAGIRGSLSQPAISPLEVLGIHARDEAERKKYARQFAEAMRQDTERVLAFQREYQQAWAELNPSGLMVDPSKLPTLTVTGWGGGNLATDGNYAWALWRPYTCCEVKGILIGYIDIITYP